MLTGLMAIADLSYLMLFGTLFFIFIIPAIKNQRPQYLLASGIIVLLLAANDVWCYTLRKNSLSILMAASWFIMAIIIAVAARAEKNQSLQKTTQ